MTLTPQNDFQLKLTQYWIKKFKKELRDLKKEKKTSIWHKAQVDSLNSIIKDLKQQVCEYKNE